MHLRRTKRTGNYCFTLNFIHVHTVWYGGWIVWESHLFFSVCAFYGDRYKFYANKYGLCEPFFPKILVQFLFSFVCFWLISIDALYRTLPLHIFIVCILLFFTILFDSWFETRGFIIFYCFEFDFIWCKGNWISVLGSETFSYPYGMQVECT